MTNQSKTKVPEKQARGCVAPSRSVVTPEYHTVVGDTEYQLTVLLPGVGKEGLSLNLEGRQLTLTGKPQFPSMEGFKTRHREFDLADYHAVFNLPEGIDGEGIQAAITNGVLVVTLPKAAALLPRKIEVASGAGA